MQVKQISANTINVSHGGGCFLTVFGSAWLFMGLFAIMTAVFPESGVMRVNGGAGAGFFFFIAGFAIALGRKGTSLDKKNKTRRSWFSILITLWSKTEPISDDFRVRIAKEVRRSNKNTTIVYPIYVVGGGEKPIATSNTYEISRRTAEKVAVFLQANLQDDTSGQKVLREAKHLNESLVERIKRTGETAEIPQPPTDIVSTEEKTQQGIQIHIPAQGFSLKSVIRLAAPAAMGAIFLSQFILPFFWDLMTKGIKGDDWILLIFFTIFTGGVLLFLYAAIAVDHESVTITVDKNTLTIKEKCIITFTTTMQIKDIEEFRFKPTSSSMPKSWRPGRPLTLITDKKTVNFAKNLSNDEKAYLKAIIIHAMLGS